ncbi:MAG: hypothetical protein U0136_10695 [Bdellovibrionota bacterium]
MAEHAYPAELAQFVSGHWPRARAPEAELSECGTRPELLQSLISVCFQASLLREEARPVTFRAIFCRPECFRDNDGAVTGFHLLRFEEGRDFTPGELRALSQAANFYRSLIGVEVRPDGTPRIWGVVHSGPRWLREAYGGRRTSMPLPPSVVVCVNGPGYIEVCRGSTLVGQLRDGLVYDESMNVFESRWLAEQYAAERNSLIAVHNESEDGKNGARLDPGLPRKLGQQFFKRIIAAVQGSHHGGTIITVPEEMKAGLCCANPYVNIKYRFAESGARARYRALMLEIMRIVATEQSAHTTVGWPEYEKSGNQNLFLLDEALFEMSYLIAGLTAVDGAVIMTKRFELLGFGAEITCQDIDVPEVAKALDIEAESVLLEHSDAVGTRHRSAYRFTKAVAGSIAVVISQDGDVRLVRNRDGQVTYWNHRPSLQVTP